MDAFLDTLSTRLAFASAQALLLGALVYAVCRSFPSLSASTRSLLWWLLGAQLIVGIVAPAPFELPLLPAPAPVTAQAAVMDVPQVTDAGATQTTTLNAGAISWIAIVLGLWAIGILGQLIVAAVRGARLAGVLRRSLAHDDVRVDTLCAKRARELGLRRSPRLAVSREVDSPQVVGFLRPTILLPLDERLDDDELDMALMHELAHVRRGDLVLGWVPVLARTLFFFHPLVHLATREYAICREAACDALVVSRGRQAARTYGRMLLRLGVTPHPHHALAGASPTFRTLKRRLDMLGQATQASRPVFAFCLVAAIAVVGVTPWRVVAADSATTRPVAFVDAAPAPPPAPAAPAAPMADEVTMPVPPPAPVAPMAPPTPATAYRPGPGHLPDHAFIYFGDDIHVMNGSNVDFQRAEAARAGAGEFVWYRDGAQAWVLKDPAYLKRIEKAFARSAVPAESGRMSAEKMADIDRQQAILNEQMSKLAHRQAELAVKETMPMRPDDRAAYAAGHAAIGKEQAELAKKMAELGQLRAMNGKTQAEWGRQQAAASRKAAEEVNAIVAEAIRDRAATAVR
ncbi:Signal transducer regulating beta-lactamase production, contains metallopeptidase domain [Luteibacter sp. UNC138MFCol5.1]|uniref:M56 family metallopeptidase n=1 Tax=Luteibacter sp. UNC138MFCol5.1 TaxID=1502774 RepID=UPI0008C5F53C|nr:M56 family metallopeptidase [Luteibacter sp. UNC138MFCol5.1]SEO68174.1 Signal transducer regulating beta-lactamase production, contains metallopeptidase domain [Luteibacter sp. UNC138MFCol5.1]